MRKRWTIPAVLAVGLAFGTSAAWGGTGNQAYDTTVASFGGYGYTGYQTKFYGDVPGYMNSYTVGGNYSVSARLNASDWVGAWTGYVVDDGTNHYLNHRDLSVVQDSWSVRLQFTNRYETTVQVQVDGTWRSN